MGWGGVELPPSFYSAEHDVASVDSALRMSRLKAAALGYRDFSEKADSN